MCKLPHINKPCKDCPMRKDSLKGWLGEIRMTEILNQDSFVCHKDTTKQCAGHMLLLKLDNAFYRTAKGFGIELNLSGQELIFDNKQQCIVHHLKH